MLSLKKAAVAACCIVAFVVVFVLGSELALGFTSGGLLIVCVSLLMGIGGFPPTKQELKCLIGGMIYGVLFGEFFAIFKPVFILAVLVLITGKLADRLPMVLNDYALTFISIYSLPGVARPETAWQDAIILVVSCAILFLLCTVIEKKALATMGKIPERTPLPPEEESKPYAKYYYQELRQPDAAVAKAAAKVISPKRAMPITSISDLCDKNAPYAENGFCVMPDGSGYVAVRQFLPGVTKEMMGWWGAWHPQEDLRYKLWYYPGHKSIRYLTTRAVPTETNMPERIEGRESFGLNLRMVEDTGMGDEYVDIHFLSPEQMGFDMERMENDDIVFISGGNGASMGLEAGSRRIPAVVCHVAYEADGGLLIQSHFWMGWRFDDGEAHLMLPPGGKIPVFGPKALSDHCVREFANLAGILPQLYREQHEEQ